MSRVRLNIFGGIDQSTADKVSQPGMLQDMQNYRVDRNGQIGHRPDYPGILNPINASFATTHRAIYGGPDSRLYGSINSGTTPSIWSTTTAVQSWNQISEQRIMRVLTDKKISLQNPYAIQSAIAMCDSAIAYVIGSTNNYTLCVDVFDSAGSTTSRGSVAVNATGTIKQSNKEGRIVIRPLGATTYLIVMPHVGSESSRRVAIFDASNNGFTGPDLNADISSGCLAAENIAGSLFVITGNTSFRVAKFLTTNTTGITDAFADYTGLGFGAEIVNLAPSAFSSDIALVAGGHTSGDSQMLHYSRIATGLSGTFSRAWSATPQTDRGSGGTWSTVGSVVIAGPSGSYDFIYSGGHQASLAASVGYKTATPAFVPGYSSLISSNTLPFDGGVLQYSPNGLFVTDIETDGVNVSIENVKITNTGSQSIRLNLWPLSEPNAGAAAAVPNQDIAHVFGGATPGMHIVANDGNGPYVRTLRYDVPAVELSNTLTADGSLLYLSGAELLALRGTDADSACVPTHAGFSSLTPTAGAGNLLAGTYLLCCFNEKKLPNGDTVRSEISPISSVTIGAGQDTIVAALNDIASGLTSLRYPVSLKFARTTAANATVFFVGSLNDVCTLPDTQLTALPQLFVNTGELEPFEVGPVALVANFKDRLMVVRSEQPNVIYPSKPKQLGIGHEWSLFSSVTFGAPITAMIEHGDKFFVFTKNSVFFISGSGPNALGFGAYSEPYFISTEIGSTSKNIAATDAGILFHSHRGIHLLGRDLSITDIPGQRLAEHAHKDWVACVHNKDSRKVFITMDDGSIFCWDGAFAIWTRYFRTNNDEEIRAWMPITSGAGGVYGFVKSTRALAREVTSESLRISEYNALAQTHLLSTGWISVEPSGMQRLYAVVLTCSIDRAPPANFVLQAILDYDFGGDMIASGSTAPPVSDFSSTTSVFHFTYMASQEEPYIGRLVLTARPQRVRHCAVRITIMDQSAIKWTNLKINAIDLDIESLGARARHQIKRQA